MNEIETARRCAEALWEVDNASRLLGIEVEVTAPGSAVARMRVRKSMVNGFDVCHGGMLFTLADTAFAFAANSYNRVTLTASGKIEFLRPAMLDDQLEAVASEDHRGRRTGFYTVKVTNQIGKVMALFRGRSVSRDDPILVSDS